jgi:hypothetical protein
MINTKRITIKYDGEEYRVPGVSTDKAQEERESYYTDDREDAIGTGHYLHGKDVTFTIRRIPQHKTLGE